jgi:predicted acylesterase/phospholipase RssA
MYSSIARSIATMSNTSPPKTRGSVAWTLPKVKPKKNKDAPHPPEKDTKPSRRHQLERETLATSREGSSPQYDAMVFSSGGSRGIGHLGAIDMLHRQSPTVLESCRYFIGSSAGAVIATILAMGIHPKDGMDGFIVPFRYRKDIRLHLMSSLFGIEGGKSLEDFLETVVARDITFKYILDTYGTVLSIIGSNLSTSTMEIFDPIRTPDMSVFDALRISCAVPLLFTAVRKDGCYYVDGAVTNPFPVDVAMDVYGCRHILGLRFDTIQTANPQGDVWTLDIFLGAVVDTLIHSNTMNIGGRRGVTTDICTIKLPNDVSGINFDIGPEQKYEIFDAGAESMLTFLKKKHS